MTVNKNIEPYANRFEVASEAVNNGFFVRCKNSEVLYMVVKITNDLVFLNDAAYSYKEFFENFVWISGQQCGMIHP